jgi:hypothetical protein
MFDVTTKNCYGYEGLIDSFEVDVLLDGHDDDYQGDSFYLLRDGDGCIGYLNFGWGSCSGCDAYEDARDSGDAALMNLRDELWEDVSWFDSLEDLRVYFKENDVKLKWYGHSSTFKDFLKRVDEL